MNKIILIGRLVNDTELKTLNNGTNYVQGTIAVNRNYKNSEGNYEADFIDFSAFGLTAELINKYFVKGDRIGIIGRLQSRSYTNQQGQKMIVREVIVENIEFLQDKKKVTQPSEEETYTLPEDDLPF